MKGIVLAGGLGTRLAPLTKNDNKHLLPIYNKRMVEYPIKTLTDIGIKDIVLITGGKRPGEFLELLKNGEENGIEKLFYAYQKGNAGIVDALKLAKPFVEVGEGCVVILGDNYFEKSLKTYYERWLNSYSRASVLLKKVDTPWDFGIAEIENSRIVSIEEKPQQPKSSYAITGVYFFDEQVWDFVRRVEPSKRNEYEITDVLEYYLLQRELTFFKYGGYWKDMGTFPNMMEVSRRVERMEKNNV